MDDYTALADQGHTLNAIRSETGVLIQTSSSGAIHLSAAEAGRLSDALAAMAEASYPAFAAQASAVASEQAASDDIRVAEAAVQKAQAELARAKAAPVAAPQPASASAKTADLLPPSPTAAPTVKARPWEAAAGDAPQG